MTKLEYEIKEGKYFLMWSGDMEEDKCIICRNHIMDLCTNCGNNPEVGTKECVVSKGKCKHIYHDHCIKEGLKTKSTCPLDNL